MTSNTTGMMTLRSRSEAVRVSRLTAVKPPTTASASGTSRAAARIRSTASSAARLSAGSAEGRLEQHPAVHDLGSAGAVGGAAGSGGQRPLPRSPRPRPAPPRRPLRPSPPRVKTSAGLPVPPA